MRYLEYLKGIIWSRRMTTVMKLLSLAARNLRIQSRSLYYGAAHCNVAKDVTHVSTVRECLESACSHVLSTRVRTQCMREFP